VISEPSVALFTVNGCQMDALVSDYSSKDKSSTGQKTRWQAAPIETARTRYLRTFPYGSVVEIVNIYLRLKKTGRRAYLPARNLIRHLESQWRCRTASGRNRIQRLPHRHGGGIWDRRNRRQGNPGSTRWGVPSGLLPRNVKGTTQLQQQNEAFGDLAQIISIVNSIGPIPQFQSKSQWRFLDGLTLCAKGRRSM
jgi:hypothetical protein